MTTKKEARIYWEKQTLALCGHHSLNALLQGPHVSTQDLQKIADVLDEAERKLGVKDENGPSENVDVNTGNYSLQVLEEALKKTFQLKLTSVFKRTELNEAAKNKAFLLNAHQHWFAIREIRGQWWNLNSQLAAPSKVNGEIVWYLESMIQRGTQVFAVVGALPQAHEIFGQKDGEYGNWIAESECEEMNEIMARAEREGKTVERVKEEMKEEKKRKMIFSGKANTLRGGDSTNNNNDDEKDDDDAIVIDDADIGVDRNEDPELYAAMKASLEEEARKRKKNSKSVGFYGGSKENREASGRGGGQRQQEGTTWQSLGKENGNDNNGTMQLEQEPDESPDTLSVAVRLPDGERLKPRRFRKSNSVKDVENWIASESNTKVTFKSRGGDQCLVLVHFPKRTTLDDPGKTLEQCGFENREMLTFA